MRACWQTKSDLVGLQPHKAPNDTLCKGPWTRRQQCEGHNNDGGKPFHNKGPVCTLRPTRTAIPLQPPTHSIVFHSRFEWLQSSSSW